MSTPPLIPAKAIALILDAEGFDQPGKWPGEDSGITLGRGCDIGADPDSLEFWRGILSDNQIARLAKAKGLTGASAEAIAHNFADIIVSHEQADKVFYGFTLPIETQKTLNTFPGIENLPVEVLGALTSLVFNRGTAMQGDRRSEMRAIRDAIANSKADPGETEQQRVNNLLAFIAGQLRDMKRLWVGHGVGGLLARRNAESALVLSAQVA